MLSSGVCHLYFTILHLVTCTILTNLSNENYTIFRFLDVGPHRS